MNIEIRHQQNNQIAEVLLTDTEGDLTICSPLTDHSDGSFSFETMNEKTGAKYRNTIRIEEVRQ